MGPDCVLVGARFLHAASTMVLWGAFAYLAALVPRDLALATGRTLDGTRRVAIGLATLATMAALPLQAGAIGDGWRDAIDPGTVRAVLLGTGVGRAWMVQAALALVLLATVALPEPRRAPATAIASGLLLASLALTGHAAMHQGWLRLAHMANDALHVLAAGAWTGALIPLVIILRNFERPDRLLQATSALRRFSTAGHVAVALAIVTGTINTALILGRWPTDWTVPYQALLAAKIGLVALMTGVALANRYGLVTRMRTTRTASIRMLARSTLVEIGLAIGVLMLVSVFGTLDPT